MTIKKLLSVGLVYLSIITPLCAMESELKLFPDKGPQKVKLPFPYYSPTEAERAQMKIIEEGCFTVLEKPDDCVMVGSLQPCQLIELTNNSKNVVGHLVYNASLLSLLKHAKVAFEDADLSETTGNIFTTTRKTYDQPHVLANGYPVSYKDLCQGRTQLQELKKIKDTIIEEFEIVDRSQLQAQKFTNPLQDGDLGDYEFADTNVFLKYGEKKLSINSVCPMAENIYGPVNHLPLDQRYSAFRSLKIAHMENNPYYKQFEGKDHAHYGRYAFAQIKE